MITFKSGEAVCNNLQNILNGSNILFAVQRNFTKDFSQLS